MSDVTYVPVLIAGAGPVGCTMAAELQRYGVAFRLIDRAPGPTEQSRALGLQTRTLELFHRIDGPAGNVAAAIAGAARKLEAVTAHDAAGKMLARLPIALDPAITRYPNEVILPQGRTQRFLLEHLAAAGGKPEFDTELVEMEARHDGVHCLLRRADGGEERVEAQWVIGADGAPSIVRRLIGDNFIGAEYEDKFLLADVQLRWSLPESEAHVFLRREGVAVAFPFPEAGHWRLVDTSGEASTGEKAPTIARFQQILSPLVPDLEIIEAGWTSLFQVHRRLAERWRVGRVLLMGDAAHIHSPASGQGLNTGVQDAVNLAWKLALAVHGRAAEGLLDSYRDERRPVAEAVLKDTHRLTEAILTRNPVIEHVRDWLIGFASGAGAVERRIAENMSKTGLTYRGSPIVAGTEKLAVKPGDRLPDPPLADGRRLSDLAGAGHTVFVLGDEADAAVRTAISDRSLSDMVAVRQIGAADEAAVREVLGSRTRSVAAVLVRPDFYLGYCGEVREGGHAELARGVGEALDRVFGRSDGSTEPHRAHGPGAKPYDGQPAG